MRRQRERRTRPAWVTPLSARVCESVLTSPQMGLSGALTAPLTRQPSCYRLRYTHGTQRNDFQKVRPENLQKHSDENWRRGNTNLTFSSHCFFSLSLSMGGPSLWCLRFFFLKRHPTVWWHCALPMAFPCMPRKPSIIWLLLFIIS